jgi:hypothetical protein
MPKYIDPRAARPYDPAASAARATFDDKVDWDAQVYNSAQGYRDDRDAEADRQFNVGAAQADAARRDAMTRAREALAEQRRQFDLAHALDRDRFGGDLLKTAASMRGPLQWVQGDMYAQGVAGSGLSPYVAALRGGTAVQYGGGTATQGNPTPLTVGTLANALTGGGNGGGGNNGSGGSGTAGGGGQTDAYGRPLLSPQVQQGVDATASIYEKGLANTPLGFLESMTEDQRDAFTSASDYLGRNTRSEYEYYKRSRPGQGRASSA